MSSEGGRPVIVLDELNGFFLSLIVPKLEVKTVKQALEAHSLLDKALKIIPFDCGRKATPSIDLQPVEHVFEAQSLSNKKQEEHDGRSQKRFTSSRSLEAAEQYFMIPTNWEVHDIAQQNHETRANQDRDAILCLIGLEDHADIEAHIAFRRRPSTHPLASNQSLLAQAVRRWLYGILSPFRCQPPVNMDSLLNVCKWTYTIYVPMVLLPTTFLSQKPWPQFIEEHAFICLPELYSLICQQLKVTHMAINGPIPALRDRAKTDASSSNILRSPSNLVAVHGDFGESDLPPTEQNFQNAFWVSSVQNSVTQIWAPLYTMFSRGNVREKTRLLELASHISTLSPIGPRIEPKKMSAVDLYAGIGYFAFSYAKSGIGKVLCWELNGWSIEGLKRGAEKNGWMAKVAETAHENCSLGDADQGTTNGGGDERFLIFHESNTNAAKRVQELRDQIPPIRHVNCGYLPSSSESWKVAVRVLDPVEGGWIHAHENVAMKDVERRKREMVEIFGDLVDQYHIPGITLSFKVECQHVEQVKAYAPGIIHCVFDIAILPIPL